MNLFEIVNMLELESSISEEQQLEAAEMLRRQHKAIKVLREACQQVFDQWGHCQATKKCMKALADTEEICKSE